MALEWKLRKVMAEKNIWSGAELSRLLQDLANTFPLSHKIFAKSGKYPVSDAANAFI